ncbi:MAG: CBS-domain-containing membrane protein [Hydrogenophaga sp.]|jgi:CBS-domain-containing membrane protein
MNPHLLPSFHFAGSTRFAQSKLSAAQRVTLDSPALSVMTDLELVRAATVRPDETLLMAREHMIHQGVRLLFVVSDMPCVDGLITTTDLDGERPMQVIARRGVRYDDLVVTDVMSPLATLDAVGMEYLRHATVAKVVATIRHLGRRHMLVVDHGQDGQTPVLRGVISQTQIERQLGHPIDVIEHAHNFAEISASLLP